MMLQIVTADMELRGARSQDAARAENMNVALWKQAVFDSRFPLKASDDHVEVKVHQMKHTSVILLS